MVLVFCDSTIDAPAHLTEDEEEEKAERKLKYDNLSKA